MSLRTTLLSGAVLTNLVVAVSSVAVVPQLTEHIADRKLDALIVELASAPTAMWPGEASTTDSKPASDPTLPADASVSTTVPVAVHNRTESPPTSKPSAPAEPAALTRAAVDARPPSPGAVPPAAVSDAVDDEFDRKGIARASDEQQLSLAKAVCSAFDQGYSREEIVARALQEEGTTESGVNRFLEVAVRTTCPEHRDR
jgi:hypothetical protein